MQIEAHQTFPLEAGMLFKEKEEYVRPRIVWRNPAARRHAVKATYRIGSPDLRLYKVMEAAPEGTWSVLTVLTVLEGGGKRAA